jgi:hypothetical protein
MSAAQYSCQRAPFPGVGISVIGDSRKYHRGVVSITKQEHVTSVFILDPTKRESHAE